MAQMKEFAECVGLLGDVVASRDADRAHLHAALLRAIDEANAAVAHLDPLRVTVGDEVQGVYGRMGDALHAAMIVRNGLFGTADMRFGLGGGDVRIIDEDKGIQDGSAWWQAREAIDFAEGLARQPGYSGVRTAIRDQRRGALPGIDALVRLVDSHVSGLRGGARRSLIGVLEGRDNTEVARTEGISESANSQRVRNNELRVLADSITALHSLP